MIDYVIAFTGMQNYLGKLDVYNTLYVYIYIFFIKFFQQLYDIKYSCQILIIWQR